MDETPQTWIMLFADIDELQLTAPSDDCPDLESMWKSGDSRVGFLSFSAPAGLPRHFIWAIGKGHAFDAGWSSDICLTQLVSHTRSTDV